MRKRLRIPIAVAFTFAGTAPIVAAIASCGEGGSGDDDGEPCALQREPCTQDPHDSVNMCPENVCVDSQRMCPTGCIPAGSKRYCIPDGTDAGVCPEPTICIIDGENCPAGCTPVG
jgi:hypothetical protein